MYTRYRQIVAIALFSFVASITMSLPVFGGDVLTEVLREKGVINKEDWIRIETDREKRAAAQNTKSKKDKDRPAIAIWTQKWVWI